MDINAACSGFVYALVTAYGLINLGFERILVIGADTLSNITDWTDRGTAILFADGGGAVVLEASAEQTLLGFDLGSDGSARSILDCDHGGKLHMEGREVFKRAVRAVVSSAEIAMKGAGVTADEIAWLVPHQANIRIIQSAADKLRHPHRTVLHRVAQHGQHVGRLDPARTRRRDRRRSHQARRPRVDVGLRRGHDVGERGRAVGRVSTPRTVLVTGGNRGIGLATAKQFAAQGHRVAITYRSEAPADCEGLLAVRCDVTDAQQVDDAFDQIDKELGPVEVVVSNAGITRDGLVLRMKDDDFTDVLDANLTAGFRVARARGQGNDEGPLGPHRLRVVDRGRRRPGRAGELRRIQGRPRRPRAFAGQGVRVAQHHRQHRRARAHRHRHARRACPRSAARPWPRPCRSAGSVHPTRWPVSSASSRRTPPHS